MKNITILALVLSLISVVPTNVYAQDAAPTANPPVQEVSDTHNLEKASTGIPEAGIIAVAVSVLGLIALAASSSSGDATPAATSHQP